MFLDALAKGNTVRKAVELAGVGRTMVYEHRVLDPEFAMAWEQAYDEGGEAIVQEAYRRGVEGVEITHFDHKSGREWTTMTYSDRLLELLLKQRRPSEFRERYTVDQTTTIKGDRDAIRRAAEADPEAFERLSALLLGGAA